MSYWVEVEITINKPGKFSVRRAFADITEHYGGSLRRSEVNPNLYHLSYPDDGLRVAKELQEICDKAKRFDCNLHILITNLHLY